MLPSRCVREIANFIGVTPGDVLCVSKDLWEELWYEHYDLLLKDRYVYSSRPVLGKVVLLEQGYKIVSSEFGMGREALDMLVRR